MMIVLTVCFFLSGSLMFSYWIALLRKKNLKAVGDGNPGAMNLWKSAGYQFGAVGMLLDFMKGYLPLLFIIGSGYSEGMLIVPLALAPIAGHALSPFLKGKGGKAIAVTFGVWSAITAFEAALAYAIILALLAAVKRWLYRSKQHSAQTDGLQVVFGMLLLFFYLYVRAFPAAIQWVWLGNMAILIYTHRSEISAGLKKALVRGK
ncbi:glycerol-3-phosphate acyltransferase [Paenibacillus sp. 2TAB23]|uniref:glycerol-3-phosphate acyltransferase n=1 Tax=Paenibacillus sp. 2TAB23 TaxID=3233004 RepID=UPI003F97791F